MQIGKWKAGHEKALATRELEATLLAANDLTIKEIAREMGIEQSTVKNRLGNARFKLGMQKTMRGLLMEAVRRGVIVPLSIALCAALIFGAHHHSASRPARTVPVARTCARTTQTA